MNGSTQKAINDFAKWCGEYKPLPNYPNLIIFPGDDVYKKLIWKVVQAFAPDLVPPISTDYDDPRVKEAFDGRITFEQFQFILEHSRDKHLTALGREMQKYLDNPRVYAFLTLIARAEAWFAEPGRLVAYDEKVNFVKMANLYDHAGVVSGRYQFTTDTWKRAKRDCGLYDFTQESQDIAAVYLLSTLPYTVSGSPPYPPSDKILPFILRGDDAGIEYAIELGSGTWASFPTKYEKKNGSWTLKENFDRNSQNESRYSPQSCAPLDSLLATYDEFLNGKKKEK